MPCPSTGSGFGASATFCQLAARPDTRCRWKPGTQPQGAQRAAGLPAPLLATTRPPALAVCLATGRDQRHRGCWVAGKWGAGVSFQGRVDAPFCSSALRTRLWKQPCLSPSSSSGIGPVWLRCKQTGEDKNLKYVVLCHSLRRPREFFLKQRVKLVV